MQARTLVETAVLLALRTSPLIRSGHAVAEDALSEYWIASRCRLDQWSRGLRTLGNSHSAPPTEVSGELLTQLLEDITLSEILTRIVAALCHTSERANGAEGITTIGRSALESHAESKRRLVALTDAWWGPDSPRARHASHLRGRAESWTDNLLAYMAPVGVIASFGYDRTRIESFGQDNSTYRGKVRKTVVQLLSQSARLGFSLAKKEAIDATLNRRISGAALGLLSSGGHDSFGLMTPAWVLRAERTIDDTAAWLHRLTREELSSPPPRAIRDRGRTFE